ncbi:MAG TPA: 23S rRNA (guanosine(2251)-2'-O)-methyltransferase RlmB [Acidobacteriota bacterium]|jgi:23S rRNA (guanosine2251-2'-O)-methyltransferase
MQYVFGIHPVLELLRSDPKKIERLWVAQDPDNSRLKGLASEARRLGVTVHFEPKAGIQRRAGSEHHQGVVAAVAELKLLDEDQVLERCGPAALVLILDGISDPHNLGAILRTAEGAGVEGIFLPERRTSPVSPAAIKASAGAAHHLSIARIGNVSYFLEKLRQNNFQVIGLDAAAPQLWTDVDLRRRVALVFGSEGEGLRRLVKEHCDQLVRIPMAGRVQSLNVSATAAVVLFEAVRQRSGT